MKTYISLITSLVLLVSILINPEHSQAGVTSFKDIPSAHSAKDEIDYLVSKGIISGYADGTFRPTKEVTRGQFAAFVTRSLQLENKVKTFKDVPKTNALYEEIGKAAGAGIIYGSADGTFKPNNPVTRADIAVMLDRALQLKGAFAATKNLSYSDYNLIKGGYADISVKRMAYYGIMTAYSNNEFAPKVQGTREATVVSIYSMLKVIEKGITGNVVNGITVRYGQHTYASKNQSEYTQVMNIVDEALKGLDDVPVSDYFYSYLKGDRASNYSWGSVEHMGLTTAHNYIGEAKANGVSDGDIIKITKATSIAIDLLRGKTDPLDGSPVSAYDALVRGVTDCDPEAQVYSAVLDSLGYNTMIVGGYNHADILVKLNGVWFNVIGGDFEVYDYQKNFNKYGLSVLVQPTDGSFVN